MLPWGILASSGTSAGAYELISTTVLSSTSSSVTFSSVPATYKHLQLRITARNSTSGNGVPYVRLNGDSSVNSYTLHRMYGQSGSVSSSGSGTGSYGGFFSFNIPGSDSTSGIFGAGIIDILDYLSTTNNKTMRAIGGLYGSTANIVSLNGSLWTSTSAVSSITVASNATFEIGSRFSLYGIKGS